MFGRYWAIKTVHHFTWLERYFKSKLYHKFCRFSAIIMLKNIICARRALRAYSIPIMHQY